MRKTARSMQFALQWEEDEVIVRFGRIEGDFKHLCTKSSEKERLIDIFLLFTVFVFSLWWETIVLGEFSYNAFHGLIFVAWAFFRPRWL